MERNNDLQLFNFSCLSCQHRQNKPGRLYVVCCVVGLKYFTATGFTNYCRSVKPDAISIDLRKGYPARERHSESATTETSTQVRIKEAGER